MMLPRSLGVIAVLFASITWGQRTTAQTGHDPVLPDMIITESELESLKKRFLNLELKELAERYKVNPALLEEQLKSSPALQEMVKKSLSSIPEGMRPPVGRTPPPPSVGPSRAAPDPGSPQSTPMSKLDDLRAQQKTMEQAIDVRKQKMSRPPPRDPRLNNPNVQNLVHMWEKNFGPLDKTPQLKHAMIDFFKNAADPHGDHGPSSQLGEIAGGNSDFWSWLKPDSATGHDIAKWLEQGAKESTWKMPEFGLKGWDLGMSGGNTGGDIGFAPPSVSADGAMSIGSLLLLLAAVAVVGYAVWRFVPAIRRNPTLPPADALTLLGLLNPETVIDRPGLIRAFERLSVVACGDRARAWNHRTIAEALRPRAAAADELAHLYELARYTSLTEPLPAEALAAARRCLHRMCEVPVA